MKSKKILRVLLAVIAIAGLVIIALFPIKNRNLIIRVITDSGEYEYLARNDELARHDNIEYTFEDIDTLNVTGIEVYGRYKTICLKKMDVYSIATAVASVDNGTMALHEKNLTFSTTDKSLTITMNDEYIDSMYKLSATAILERVLYMGVYVLCIVAISFIGILIKEIKLRKDKRYHGVFFEVKKFGTDIAKYGKYMVYAAKTDLQAEVANSYLNRLWWLLEPFFNMLVYVIVFGNMMGASVENYATFIFSALLMWNFFNKTVNYSVKLVRSNKDIISKVYVPKFVLLLSNMVLNLFKMLFSLIVLVAMLIVFHVHIGANIIWVIPSYIMMIMLAFGVGMIFLHFGVYVDDLSYAVGILMNMLMFLSGIFYEVMTTLPSPLNMIMMCVNPVAVFIDTMRNALLYNTVTNLPLLAMWTAFSFVLCCIGVHIVYKNENAYVKVV